MGYSLENKLVIALSPAALFGADGESFGCAMPLAKGLSRLEFQGESPVELIVVSRGCAASSLPVFKQAADMGLGIIRGAFIADGELCPYLAAMGADIFLSENPEDVQQAIDAGFAAAVTAPCPALPEGFAVDGLNIAFDADAVIFHDFELSRCPGLQEFYDHETEHANIPLPPGPFSGFMKKLCELKKNILPGSPPLRTAIFTSRSAPSHIRVINSLEHMGLEPDEIFFLGGLDKTPFLRAFSANLYLDDMQRNIDSAAPFVPSARVPYR